MLNKWIMTLFVVMLLSLAACGGEDEEVVVPTRAAENGDAAAANDEAASDTEAEDADQTTENDTNNTDETDDMTPPDGHILVTSDVAIDAGEGYQLSDNWFVEPIYEFERLEGSLPIYRVRFQVLSPAPGTNFNFPLRGFSIDLPGDLPIGTQVSVFGPNEDTELVTPPGLEATDENDMRIDLIEILEAGFLEIRTLGDTLSMTFQFTVMAETEDNAPVGTVSYAGEVVELPLANPEEQAEDIAAQEAEQASEQAEADAVNVTFSGAIDATIPPVEEITYAYNSFTFVYDLALSSPDSPRIAMQLTPDAAPGTYEAEPCLLAGEVPVCVSIQLYSLTSGTIELIETGEVLTATFNLAGENDQGALTVEGDINGLVASLTAADFGQ